MHGIRLIYEIAIIGVLRSIFDLYWQDNFLTNKIQSDKDNFLDNLIYEIAIIGVLGSIFRQDNFLTIYERFWHLGGRVQWERQQNLVPVRQIVMYTSRVWPSIPHITIINNIIIQTSLSHVIATWPPADTWHVPLLTFRDDVTPIIESRVSRRVHCFECFVTENCGGDGWILDLRRLSFSPVVPTQLGGWHCTVVLDNTKGKKKKKVKKKKKRQQKNKHHVRSKVCGPSLFKYF